MMPLEVADPAAADAIRRAFARFRSAPPRPVDRLLEAARRLHAGEPLDAATAAWLAGAIVKYAMGARDGLTLDKAAGLAPAPGHVRWWTAAALARRDHLIRRLAARHFPGLCASAQARAIADIARQYAASRWPRDRRRAEMPPDYEGQPAELLWAAFAAADGRFPTTQRHLIRILGGRAP